MKPVCKHQQLAFDLLRMSLLSLFFVIPAQAADLIAERCRIEVCASLTKESVQWISEEQARCQSYYVQCLMKSRSSQLTEKQNLDVCTATRPAQILLDKAEASTAKVNAQRRIQSHRDRPEAGSARAE